jgi:hypothetical protein
VLVIGLTGHAGAGKDSVADVLVRDHGFVKMSFAAPLKRMLRNVDPIVGYDVYQDCNCGDDGCGPEVDTVRLSDLYGMGYDDESIKESPWGDEVRDLWQRFGTDTMRAENKDFWVDKAAKELLESNHDRVVFTDVRFPNEAEMILSLDGPFTFDGAMYFSEIQPSLWQISRPSGAEDDHESESHTGLLDEEVQILNEGSLEELPGAVKIALDYVIDDVITGQGLLWAGEAPSDQR